MSKPAVTVTRQLTSSVETRLSETFDVNFNNSDVPLSSSALKAALEDSDAVICTVSDQMTAELLNTPGRRASLIANVGVGFSNIDSAAAKANEIVVSNTPDVLTDATADVAWLLILASTRRAYAGEKALRAGAWKGFSVVDGLGTSLQGKTLGIIGMGRIGQAVARRAALGFGMNVIYFNRSPVEGLAHPATQMPDVETVLQEADVVSLHIPSAVDHQPIITEARLALMKPTAHLINTARGTVVDEAALIACLQASHIAGAGLDVFANEPDVPRALRELNNVTLLPHIGSATVEVRDAMGMLAVDNVVAHFSHCKYPSRVV